MRINNSDGFGTLMMLMAGFAIGLTAVFAAVASSAGKGAAKEPADKAENADRPAQSSLLKLDPVRMN